MSQPVHYNHHQPQARRLYYLLLGSLMAFLSFLNPFASAEEVQTNHLYLGGELVEFSEIGISVTIPQNWQGALPAGSSFFFIESAGLQSTMVIHAEQMSRDRLLQAMSQMVPLGDGIDLIPKTNPRKEGDLLIADYQAPAKPEIDARIIGRTGSNGLSVALITLTSSNNPGRVWTLAKETALNINFFQPQMAARSSGGNGGWQDYMSGRYIARYYSGSNYHEKQQLWLCSNGEFYTSGDSGGYGGGASGAFAHQGAGTWQANGDLSDDGELTLQYRSGGETSMYRLSLSNDKLYLNNSQWLRGANNYCQ